MFVCSVCIFVGANDVFHVLYFLRPQVCDDGLVGVRGRGVDRVEYG